MERRLGEPSVNPVTAVLLVRPKVKGAADQRQDFSPGLRNSAEYLSAAGSCLDVADTNFQVSFASFAAADEGRI